MHDKSKLLFGMTSYQPVHVSNSMIKQRLIYGQRRSTYCMTTFEILASLIFLFIYLFILFISQGQYILINISVNMPELAERLVFICSPWPDVKLAA